MSANRNSYVIVPYKVLELQREYEYVMQVYSAVMYYSEYSKEECRYVADVSLNDIFDFLGVLKTGGKQGNLYGIAVATEALADAGVFEQSPAYSTLNEQGKRVKYHYKRYFENKSHYVINISGDYKNSILYKDEIELIKSYDGEEKVTYQRVFVVLCLMRSFLRTYRKGERIKETDWGRGTVGRLSLAAAAELTGYGKRSVSSAIRVLKDLQIIKTKTVYHKVGDGIRGTMFFTDFDSFSDDRLKYAENDYHKMIAKTE